MESETHLMPAQHQEKALADAPLTEEEMIRQLEMLVLELEAQRNAMFTKNRLMRAIENVSWRFWRGGAAPTELAPETKNGSGAVRGVTATR